VGRAALLLRLSPAALLGAGRGRALGRADVHDPRLVVRGRGLEVGEGVGLLRRRLLEARKQGAQLLRVGRHVHRRRKHGGGQPRGGRPGAGRARDGLARRERPVVRRVRGAEHAELERRQVGEAPEHPVEQGVVLRVEGAAQQAVEVDVVLGGPVEEVADR